MMFQKRAQERQKKIVRTILSGLAARVVTMGIALVMVPLSVHYLGKEQYGLWVAVSSLVAMLGFMDGGAGNAVLNMVAHASGTKEGNLPKIVSTAFFTLLALGLIGALLFLAVFSFIPWGKLLGVAESTSLSELNVVVMVVGLFFFVSIFSTLVGKIQRGLQEGALDNFWSGMAAVLSLLLVYVAIKNECGLIGYVIAFLFGPMLAYFASNIHYLLIRRKDLRPRIVNIERTIAKKLFAVGGMFFVLQIAGVIQGQADNVIIANMLGPGAVADYAICMKLFLMPSMIFGLVLTPLWPAYGEAFTSGDIEWVKRIFLKSVFWALLISVPTALILVVMGQKLIELWIGPNVIPSIGLMTGCGIWMVFSTAGGALAMLFNGMQRIKIQIGAAIATALLNVILSIYLIKMNGLAGAVFGSVIAWLLCTLIPYAIAARKIFTKQEGLVHA